MPNWVRTYVTVNGPQASLLAFKSKAAGHISPDGATQALSFESFIPMPASLLVEHSSDGKLGLEVFHGGDISRHLLAKHTIEAGVFDREGLMLWTDLTQPDARVTGKAWHDNIAEHGFATWYGWSVANWGTKWDASDSALHAETPSELKYVFDTAWSPAEPVLFAMTEQFPELTFTAQFDEESGEFYYEVVWESGERVSETQLERESCGDEDEDKREGDGLVAEEDLISADITTAKGEGK